MIRSEVDRRARNREAPVQYVSETTYDPAEKHQIRCDCTMCRCAWAGLTVEDWNEKESGR
jgi:hypothetical protein